MKSIVTSTGSCKIYFRPDEDPNEIFISSCDGSMKYKSAPLGKFPPTDSTDDMQH